jgi:hypothetical protein
MCPKFSGLQGQLVLERPPIANSIAQQLHDAGMLGSAFFFKRDRAEQSDPAKVITTLAHGMASHSLAFKVALAQALKLDSVIPASLSLQLQKLLTSPLKNSKGQLVSFA